MPRETLELIIDLDSADNKRRLMATVGALSGVYEVSIAPKRGTRSQRQNAYYWACIVKALVDFEDQQGNSMAPDEAHEFFKAKFLRRPVVHKVTGEVLGQAIRSTTKLDTNGMALYIDKCIKWLAETLNIVVPEPEPTN